jgi:hypothetical protein
MKKIEIKDSDFLKSCVYMFVGLDLNSIKMNNPVKLLILLIESSKDGYVVIDDSIEVIMNTMCYANRRSFDKAINRLEHDNHVRREKNIIYLHPKYKAIKESDGAILICKKSLQV